MRFNVRKTSVWSWEGAPCEGATSETYTNEYGVQITDWYIEIATLEDLMQFIKDNDRIVLDEESIEIYDDYRE